MPEATENATQGATAEGERTFTQSQMEAIIGDRLARERSKYSDYEELKSKAEAYDRQAEAEKTELQRAEERAEKAEADLAKMREEAQAARDRAEVAAEKGVPAEVLRGSTREELEAHTDAIKAAMGAARKYPDVSDGGDRGASKTTREDIMSIKDGRERVRMIAANPHLFE